MIAVSRCFNVKVFLSIYKDLDRQNTSNCESRAKLLL